MKEIDCNVIQDLLGIYIEGAASEETNRLVEAHLKECKLCRKVCEELESDEEYIEKEPQENKEVKDLKNFKRFLLRKRIRTVLISMVCAFAVIAAGFWYMNSKTVRIDYQDAGIIILEDKGDEVYYKTQIKGQYHWTFELDRDTGIGTIYFEQSLWEKYMSEMFYPFDHIHSILKKDMVKEIYVDTDGTETMIWEASEKEKKEYFAQEKNQPLG